MQAVQRSRELLVHERVSLSNHLRGLLMEFGIVIPQGFASLYRLLPEILEEGDIELPDLYRPTLNLLYGRQFSAYLGLTPKQFSSGGRVNLAGVSKRVANKRLRAVLIQGARAT